MPANLSEKAQAKWAEARLARDPKTKLELLRGFYSLMDKHKGTAKLQISIKRQIKSLEEEIEERARVKRGSRPSPWNLRKGELPLLVVFGRPHDCLIFYRVMVGREAGFSDLYERPLLGVVEGGGLKLQLAMAPVSQELSEEKIRRSASLGVIADLLIILLPSDDPSFSDLVRALLEERNIDIRSNRPYTAVEVASSGGIRFAGVSEKLIPREVSALLQSYGIRNALISVSRDSSVSDVERALMGRLSKKAAFVSMNGESGALAKSQAVPLMEERELFVRHLLGHVGLIRVYTKKPASPIGEYPLLLDKGSTVGDAARLIHRELGESFRHAKVWKAGSYTPVRVGPDFMLEDGDVVEIHS